MTMTPTEWFDQFPHLANEADWHNDQWCPRHWAPCPILGANGIAATLEVIQAFINEIAPSGAKTHAAMQASMEETGRLCCTLGDQRMYDIWGRCGPSKESADVSRERYPGPRS